MGRIAQAHGGTGSGWRMVACDPDGADLARDEHVVRVHWRAEAAGPAELRAELVRLAMQHENH